MKRVYLAGPIKGQSYSSANNWRDDIARQLPSIEVLSPMRHKEYLSDETAISDEYQTVMSCSRGITTRDRFDVMTCDVMLVNLLGAQSVSIGTMIELGWADAWRKPIILVIESDNIHNHAMVRELAGFTVDTIEDAISVVKSILNV